MYELSDKMVAYLNRQFIRMFGKLKSVVNFDELNIIKAVEEVYSEAEKLVEKSFVELAQAVYRANIKKGIKSDLEMLWVLGFLDEYNPVTKYVYLHEVDRKAARAAESIIASDTKTKEVDKALKYWANMVTQYADDITFQAILQAYKDDGIKRVMWMVELDNRTCGTCEEREGIIYDIDKIPPKPHIGCRCWVVPWKGETID